MNTKQKKAIIQYIKELDPKNEVIESINPNKDYSGGKIKYNDTTLHVHREISTLGDEEYARAYLVVKLVKELGYSSEERIIELEKTYSIGRPSKKSARVDLLVKYPLTGQKKANEIMYFCLLNVKHPINLNLIKIILKAKYLTCRSKRKSDLNLEFITQLHSIATIYLIEV